MRNKVVFPASFVTDRNVTATQFRVYAAIQMHTQDGEARPTIHDLSVASGIDSSRICAALKKLENGGWIERRKDGQRNIYVLR